MGRFLLCLNIKSSNFDLTFDFSVASSYRDKYREFDAIFYILFKKFILWWQVPI